MKIFNIDDINNKNAAQINNGTSTSVPDSSSASNQLIQTGSLKANTESLSGFNGRVIVSPMIKFPGLSHLTEEEIRERHRTRPTGKLIFNPMLTLRGPASRRGYVTPSGSSFFADQRRQHIFPDVSRACFIVDQTEQTTTFSIFSDPFPPTTQIRKDEGSTSDTTLGHLVGKSDSTITKLSVSSAEIQKLLSSAKATIACFKNVFKEMHQRTIDRLAGSIMPLVLFKEAYAMKLRDKIDGLITQLENQSETNGESNKLKPEQINLGTLKDLLSKTEEYSLATRSLEDAVSTLIDECKQLVQELKEDLSRKKRIRLEWDDISSQLSEQRYQAWKRQRTA